MLAIFVCRTHFCRVSAIFEEFCELQILLPEKRRRYVVRKHGRLDQPSVRRSRLRLRFDRRRRIMAPGTGTAW